MCVSLREDEVNISEKGEMMKSGGRGDGWVVGEWQMLVAKQA